MKQRIYPRSIPDPAVETDKQGEKFSRDLIVDVLARTIWGEARGEGEDGMQAVANVVLNRVAVARQRGDYWWGRTIVQVCQKPYQFSCWNKNDPNFPALIRVDMKDAGFATAHRIATLAVMGRLPDITRGADHYHARSVAPFWARDHTPVCHIGGHIFYRLIA
ncbi:MAG: cell wall hydrolase [Pseudomonadota bacterium]